MVIAKLYQNEIIMIKHIKVYQEYTLIIDLFDRMYKVTDQLSNEDVDEIYATGRIDLTKMNWELV